MKTKKTGSNKKAIWIGIAIAVILVVLAAVAVQEEDSKLETKPEIAQIDQALYKTEFMNGCVEGGNYKQCDCTYEYLKNKLGMQKFVDESIKYSQTGVFTTDMTQAVNACF